METIIYYLLDIEKNSIEHLGRIWEFSILNISRRIIWNSRNFRLLNTKDHKELIDKYKDNG